VDSLDGAVAILSARVTARGAVLDAVADRCADTASVLVLLLLWRAGAPDRWHDDVPLAALVLTLAALGCATLHEYVRARAAAAGLGGLRALTVGERPTRIIGVVMFSLAVGVLPARSEVWAPAGLGFLGIVGIVGLVQLAVGLSRGGDGSQGGGDGSGGGGDGSERDPG
jgi:CDP-diacylglycerol--glycerol-3-phosphate 3-phosphatidyltransferase